MFDDGIAVVYISVTPGYTATGLDSRGAVVVQARTAHGVTQAAEATTPSAFAQRSVTERRPDAPYAPQRTVPPVSARPSVGTYIA